MRAILCSSWGGPENLQIGSLAEPRPASGQLLIRVKAWGVNFADLVLISGTYHAKPPFPFAPGMEVTGEVIELGADTDGFRIGDRVAAYMEWGGFAELVAVNKKAAMRLPANADWVEGVALPVAYGTSHVGLIHRGQLKSGDTLLVTGAAAGVGLTAVEIGARIGATVIAAASTPEKLQLAAKYGAKHTINYTTDDITERVKDITNRRGVDVIYDLVGGNTFDSLLRCAAFEGRLVVIGFASGTIPQASAGMILIKSCAVIGSNWAMTVKNRPEIIARAHNDICRWYEAGQLHPHISQTMPFAEAPRALQLLADRKALGKIVLTAP